MLGWQTPWDFLVLLVVSIGGACGAHCWLARSRKGAGVPVHAWLLLLCLNAAGYFLADQAEHVERAQLERLVEGFAPTYAMELERMGHAKLGLDTPPDDPTYLALIATQKRWLQMNPAVSDIYTFRKSGDGTIHLLVDSETDYDRDGRCTGDREARTPIGEVYDTEMGSAFAEAWKGKSSFDDAVATDRWGTWISAYVPMFDEAGRVESVLGVDYPAESWLHSIQISRLTVLVIVFVLQTIGVGTSTTISLLRREVSHRRAIEATLAAHQADLELRISERSEDLLNAQRRILQNEKLACMGQLAAGVAHEINTPVQYIGDNLRAISESLDELLAVDTKYRELVELVRQGRPTEQMLHEVAAAEIEHDLEYLLEDTPKAISQSLDGVERVTRIVRAMKDFSHMRDEGFSSVDIKALLQSTLTIARNEYKYVADLTTEFAELPMVQCSSGEIGQVMLNLVVNAAHAIGETNRHGTLTVRTARVGEEVEIVVADTGAGIPEEVRSRIFDPFFTTKPTGKGTGQGLSIVRDVVHRHHGSIEFESRVNEGTTFRIRLPIEQPQMAQIAEDTSV